MPRDLGIMTTQPGGSAALVVNFADIEMMTGMLRRIRSEVEQQLGELGVVARRPDLIESLVLFAHHSAESNDPRSASYVAEYRGRVGWAPSSPGACRWLCNAGRRSRCGSQGDE